MMTDTMSDMIIRIKNALENRAESVVFPYSNLKTAVLKVLKENNFIENYKEEGDKKKRLTKVTLKYVNNEPVISYFKRISKPGRRVYSSSNKIPRSLNGMGTIIISTPKGVMNDKNAAKYHQGGELICEIY